MYIFLRTNLPISFNFNFLYKQTLTCTITVFTSKNSKKWIRPGNIFQITCTQNVSPSLVRFLLIFDMYVPVLDGVGDSHTYTFMGSSELRGSTSCNKEYFNIFPLWKKSMKYSSRQLYSHEIYLIPFLTMKIGAHLIW